MSTVEQCAHDEWKAEAKGEIRFGGCEHCGRARGENGKPLLVAKIKRRWTCLACWDQR